MVIPKHVYGQIPIGIVYLHFKLFSTTFVDVIVKPINSPMKKQDWLR
jgi:hypothetical protein